MVFLTFWGDMGSRRIQTSIELAQTSLGGAVGIEAVGSVHESIFTALIRIGTKLAAAGLVPLLQSEDAGLRNGAMEALKTMPEFAAECLGEIFASASDVRIFGVEILGALLSSGRLHWLRRVAEEETEVNVCAVAADTLVKSGDHEAASPLLQLLKRFPDEPYLEFAVRCGRVKLQLRDSRLSTGPAHLGDFAEPVSRGHATVY